MQKTITDTLQAGIAARLFPGAQVLVSTEHSPPLYVSAGAHTYAEEAPEICRQTVFDMASLTKVIVTTTAILQLMDQRRLALSDAVGKYLGRFGDSERGDITLFHLLTHTSGLKADVDHTRCADGDQLWEILWQSRPQSPPGGTYVYSDLGFILLGRIVEVVTGLPLDAYAREQIFEPLGMEKTCYCPPQGWLPEIAPTEYDLARRGGLIHGRVHDEKASLLGGVAGHAGLFSTADDLHRFLRALFGRLSGGDDFLLSRETVLAMLQNQTPSLQAAQGIGWFLDRTFMGALRPQSFGHTGFTGVSVAAGVRHSVICIVLTNCVYPTRPDAATREKINALRARIADIAQEMAANAA